MTARRKRERGGGDASEAALFAWIETAGGNAAQTAAICELLLMGLSEVEAQCDRLDADARAASPGSGHRRVGYDDRRS